MHTWYFPLGIGREGQEVDDGHMKRRLGEMAEMKQAGVWMLGNGKDMVVLSEGGRKVWGVRVEEIGGLEKKVSKVFVRLGGLARLVGWLLAPSTGRLPREGGSLEWTAPSRGRTTLTSSEIFRTFDRKAEYMWSGFGDRVTLYGFQ